MENVTIICTFLFATIYTISGWIYITFLLQEISRIPYPDPRFSTCQLLLSSTDRLHVENQWLCANKIIPLL
ncbi:hypothetical protein BDV23DRAFT_150885 [Aspergillus alliaceus]|uniref:Uncharacterized protein n=1 Tax=Petromyces alliaceus TaxID=209559 RepID=A0A5N6G0T7_PETAA|nr:uncharacterized protein BDW43DRAFT_272495 [Aspergillus alliaceus]KAB8234664.1 hypothetical protein BDW43DRAFT_272495 [Aspergillus alliaceus]KAE8392696.1 hypothetical protein BDV23DRAFT_150885 [Aspergillus alliaceus]